MRAFVFIAILVALSGLSFSVSVSSCTVINAPGSYDLTGNIVAGTPQSFGPFFGTTCIGINTSNVALNCAGFNIGASPSFSNGIIAADSEALSSLNNITIANCTVNGSLNTSFADSAGIHIENITNSTLQNNTVRDVPTGGSGFFIFGNNSGTLVTNNTAANIAGNGFEITGPGDEGRNTISSNTAYNTSIGFEVDDSTLNIVVNNTAYNNSFNGFHLWGSNNSLLNNVAYGNGAFASFDGGIMVECCSAEFNLVANNTAYDNNGDGIHQYYSVGNVFANNTAYGNSNHGIFVEGDPATLSGNTAYLNSVNGFYLLFSDFSNFSGNSAFNNSENGFSIDSSDNTGMTGNGASDNALSGFNFTSSSSSNLTSNIAFHNSRAGFYFGSVPSPALNLLVGNLAYNNTDDGFEFDASFNTLIGNVAHDNSNGFSFDFGGVPGSADSNSLTGNSAYNDSSSGFTFDSSSNNTLLGNIATGHGGSAGFYFSLSSDNTLSGNIASANCHGFYFQVDSNNNLITGNAASGNGCDGFLFVSFADNNTLTGNSAFNNGDTGIEIKFGSNSTTLSGNHLFNNHADFSVDNEFQTDIDNVNSGGMIFDNPLGTFQDYTNISMNDTFGADEVYTMNWSAQPAPLPPSHGSFANKYLNITSQNASPSIEFIQWNWLDSEVTGGGYDESKFELWKYNSSGWTQMNNTPDTASNTLSLTNVDSFSVFAILQNTACPAPITSPGSYSLTSNVDGAPNDASEYSSGAGACIKIAASNVDFDCTGFSVGNNGTGGTTFGVFINGSATNVTVRNCIINNGYTFGAGIFQSDGNFLLSNTAFNNTNGFLVEQGNGNILIGNNADNSTGRGFDVRSGSVFNTLDLNNATGNGQEGFSLNSGSDNNILVNNIASFSASQGGFTFGGVSGGSSNNQLVGNIAQFNDGEGFTCVGLSSNNTLVTNLAFNNTLDGFFFQTCTNNSLINNSASFNGQSGFTAQVGSDGNTFDGNLFDSNGDAGLRIVGSALNILTGNNATNNGLQGFLLQSASSGNTLSGNFAQNNINGFQVTDSDNNTLAGNDASGNTQHGFFIDPASGNNLTGNTAELNTNDGFVLYGGFGAVTFNRLENNTAHDNGGRGFTLDTVTDNSLINSVAYANTLEGIFISDSNNTVVTTAHLYSNNPDMTLSGTGHTVTLSGVVFDSPSGNFSGYTNLSLSDVLDSSYSLDHALQPAAPLPTGAGSFAGKFVNITNTSGNVSVDTALWTWLDSEVSAGNYSEGLLRLYRFDGAFWLIQNTTPDTAANVLGNSPITEFGIYAILQVNTTGDTDGGGNGESGGALDMNVTPICNGFVISVTQDGDPVENAFVKATDETHGSEFTPMYTDSEGKTYYNTCDIDVSATATKSGDDGDISKFAACGICAPACTSDSECPATDQCVLGQCQPVQCSCGQVSQHQCVNYQCCSDSQCSANETCLDHQCKPKFECDLNGPGPEDDNADCGSTQFCDVPEGQAGGTCKDVVGQCGFASDHSWVQYDCGPEAGCPSCPSGQECSDHQCVQKDIKCPGEGVVGKDLTCKATENELPCPLCDLLITGPDGKNFTGKTGPDGSFNFPLKLTGIYKVAILDSNGRVIKLTEVRATAGGGPTEGETPTTTGQGPFAYLWLIILLVLVVLGILYWRRRGGGKPAAK